MKIRKELLAIMLCVIATILMSGCGNASEPNDYIMVQGSKTQNKKTYDVSYEKSPNVDENTVFELASNGKMIAAYTALSLVDEGLIELDDTIYPFLSNKYITDDERMKEITLRELLSHTAGFSPSYEITVDKKIYSDPGSKFRYSGVGYIYLQNVIENVSGLSMQDAAEKYVFAPLNMKNSTFESCKTITPYINSSSVVIYAFAGFLIAIIVLTVIISITGAVTKYKLFTKKTGVVIGTVLSAILNALFILFVLVSKVFWIFVGFLVIVGAILFGLRKSKRLYWLVAPALTVLSIVIGLLINFEIPVCNDVVKKDANCAYSLKSTAADMNAFCKKLMEQVDSNSVYADMFKETIAIDEKNSWGLGIAIEKDSEKAYWHSGINPGFQSLVALCPESGKYIFVLTNSDSGLKFAKEKVNKYLDIDGEWEIRR